MDPRVDWDRDRLWEIQWPPISLPPPSSVGASTCRGGEAGTASGSRCAGETSCLTRPSFPSTQERLIQADLRWPVYMIRRHDRWLILDGIHRGAKGQLLQADYIDAFVLTPSDLPAFAVL
jgi:hypothetical protein